MNNNSNRSFFSAALPDSVNEYLNKEHIDLLILNTPVSDLSSEAFQKIYDAQLAEFMKKHPELVKNGTYDVTMYFDMEYLSECTCDSYWSIDLKKQRLKERKVKGADKNKKTKSMSFQGDLGPYFRSTLLQKISFLSDVGHRGNSRIREYIETLNQFSVATYYRWRKDFMNWADKNPDVLGILSNVSDRSIRNWSDAAFAYRDCPRMLKMNKDRKKEYFACIVACDTKYPITFGTATNIRIP